MTALTASLATLGLSLYVFISYYLSDAASSPSGSVQMVDLIEGWLPFEALNAQYLLGVDGLSAPLVLLTGILGAAAAFASRYINFRIREYFVWLLLLQSTVMGVFLSLDLLLFFVFFEFELAPMFMLISIWGSGRKVYSATKFVIFTLTGGSFMFVAIILLFLSDSVSTLAMVSIPEAGIVGIPDLINNVEDVRLIVPAAMIFGFFLAAFSVKLPIWPLHNWLPDAHTDAPTAVSVMLAGVLLKMGGYGIFRINLGFFSNVEGFPIKDAAWVLSWVAAVSVIYGAIVTIKQTDMKRLIAYSSISHMGYVMLGAFAIGSLTAYSGAALQMFTHGTITGLAFLMVGFLYERVHTRYIPHLGGLAGKLPLIAIFFTIAGLASLGLPGLAGFASEILLFLGAFSVWPLQTGIAAFGVVLTAGYVLWMVQRVFLGTGHAENGLPEKFYNELKDADWLDIVPILILTIPIVIVGIWPSFIVRVLHIGFRGFVSW